MTLRRILRFSLN